MSARRRVAPLVALALTLVPLAACGSSDQRSGTEHTTTPGLAAITVTPLTDAPAIRFGRATATPMVVNVWATWCVPCRKEMPAFDAVAKQYDGAVRFVGINLGDTAALARQFVDETGVSFDQYLDPDSTAQAVLGITSMPATVLLRADGTIAATHNGALDAGELTSLLHDRLQLDAPATPTG